MASASEIGTKASITNTLKTVNVTAVKTWKDQNNKFEIRPDSITIHLYQNGVPIGEDATISVNADGTWTHTFEDVPKCDAHGQDYVYTVKEDSVNGYNTSYEGMTIINTLITTDVTVQVNWKDFDDQWKLRPETVHITLLKNGKPFDGSKVDLSGEDDWTHVFTDLPLEDAEGNAYIYTVTEDDIHAYDKKIDHTQETLLTITNTLKTRDITATKNWVDDDNKRNTRPNSITLRLTQRKKVASASELSPASDEIQVMVSEMTAASDGSWTTSFDHLPVEDKKGHSYSYDVSEDTVSGYTSSIEADSDHSHYTVTNTYKMPTGSSGGSGGSHVGPGPKPGNEPGPTGGPEDTIISTLTPDEGRVLGASRGPAPVQNGGRVLGASRNAGTGDMSLMLVWFVLMLAALGLLAGYVIYIRKHRRNRT